MYDKYQDFLDDINDQHPADSIEQRGQKLFKSVRDWSKANEKITFCPTVTDKSDFFTWGFYQDLADDEDTPDHITWTIK